MVNHQTILIKPKTATFAAFRRTINCDLDSPHDVSAVHTVENRTAKTLSLTGCHCGNLVQVVLLRRLPPLVFWRKVEVLTSGFNDLLLVAKDTDRFLSPRVGENFSIYFTEGYLLRRLSLDGAFRN